MNVFNMLMPINTKDEKIIDSNNNNVMKHNILKKRRRRIRNKFKFK